ncbi:MAG: vanadium-dependent haloperoxidase [Saprospiraceae bacterium]
MNIKSLFLAAFALLLWLPACKQTNNDYQQKANNAEFMHAGVKRITDIIRHDIFAPPVASRIFAYSVVAAYEALVPGFPEYQSLAGQLNGLTPGPKPEAGKEYCFPLASVNAQLIVGKNLVFSEGEVTDLEEKTYEDFKKMNMPQDVYDRSMAFGEAIAKHIMAWSKTDNYAQTRSAPKFTIDIQDPARWRPTPPAYGDALEPFWRKLRPWVMDSAGFFPVDSHVPFSTDKNSEFYKQAKEVYDIVNLKNPENEATAWYWDDNPFAMEVSGHVSFAKKKISPAGHWLSITGVACRKANLDIIKSAEAYVKVACALADAFISSWDIKYKTNLIRPESYINQYVDPSWQPLIQTPPFPEHTSGHSTISMASATVLTGLFNDSFAFTDSTEVEFGLPPRSFTSFTQAAEEVGMSRLYGGIHYRRGNEAGLKCGALVGKYVLTELKTRK